MTTTSEISISRVFDAPRELVYRAFVDPDQLRQWFGPVGFSVPYESRPGRRQGRRISAPGHGQRRRPDRCAADRRDLHRGRRERAARRAPGRRGHTGHHRQRQVPAAAGVPRGAWRQDQARAAPGPVHHEPMGERHGQGLGELVHQAGLAAAAVACSDESGCPRPARWSCRRRCRWTASSPVLATRWTGSSSTPRRRSSRRSSRRPARCCQADGPTTSVCATPGSLAARRTAERGKGPSFVLTHRPPADPDVTFLSGDIEPAVAIATAAAGDRDLVVVGADVSRQCLDRGLVDEILVLVLPVLLGAGTRFYTSAAARRVELEPVSSAGPAPSRCCGSACASSRPGASRSAPDRPCLVRAAWAALMFICAAPTADAKADRTGRGGFVPGPERGHGVDDVGGTLLRSISAAW